MVLRTLAACSRMHAGCIADVTTFAASCDSDVMESGTIVSISEDSEAPIDAACGERRARERRAACGVRWRWCAVAVAALVLSGVRLDDAIKLKGRRMRCPLTRRQKRRDGLTRAARWSRGERGSVVQS